VQKAARRTAEAGDLLRRAVSLDPRHAGSHYNLAVVADDGGDLITAVTHYRAFSPLRRSRIPGPCRPRSAPA